jgi:hypothetical protein
MSGNETRAETLDVEIDEKSMPDTRRFHVSEELRLVDAERAVNLNCSADHMMRPLGKIHSCSLANEGNQQQPLSASPSCSSCSSW